MKTTEQVIADHATLEAYLKVEGVYSTVVALMNYVADDRALSFQRWKSNQVIAGRTTESLWIAWKKDCDPEHVWPKLYNHDHFYIEHETLLESYKTIRGLRSVEVIAVPGMEDTDICSAECLQEIADRFKFILDTH